MTRLSRLVMGSVMLVSGWAEQSKPTSQPAGVEWDRSTLRLIAPGGHYGRVIRMKSGEWVAGYSRGPAVWARVSGDGGKSWDEPVRVADFANGHATNSELLELSDGR